MKNERGIVLELSSEVAEELRCRLQPSKSETDGDNNNKKNDAWNVLMPPVSTPSTPTAQPSSSLQDENDDDSLSSSPPPSLPQILVHVPKLVGYTPEDADSAKLLAKQLYCAIMLGTTTEDSEEESNSGECLERIQKLFDQGLARHTDTSLNDNSNPENGYNYVRIDYPPKLWTHCHPTTTTARVWKRILQRKHGIPVLDRLLSLVQNCQQSLFWKRDMHVELTQLACREAHEHWQRVGRASALQELYAARETVVHRYELAQQRVEALTEEREVLVRQSASQHDTVGLFEDGYDLTGNRLSEEEEYDDDFYLLSDDDESSSSGASHSTASSDSSGVVAENTRAEEEAAAAKQELETKLREELTSNDLKMATMAVKAIKLRVERVDELLETLQDEEWEQQEESNGQQSNPPESSFSLLDQVLAMILGSTPPKPSQSLEAHVQYLEKEHLEIVAEWKQQFGRLPPPVVERREPTRPSAERNSRRRVEHMKRNLGIVDNETSDWDDEEST